MPLKNNLGFPADLSLWIQKNTCIPFLMILMDTKKHLYSVFNLKILSAYSEKVFSV